MLTIAAAAVQLTDMYSTGCTAWSLVFEPLYYYTHMAVD